MQDEYSGKWIKKLRNGMRQKEFGEHIYVFKKNGSVCKTVHRNTIGNWETGKTSMPRDVETFLSLALWEYDHFVYSAEEEVDSDENMSGNRRYQHARKRLLEMLRLDLYCKNLHDALLIQVARGILQFKEVPELEKELESKLSKIELSTEEKNVYAMERNTVSISADLNRVRNVDELINLITVVHKNSFASSNRTIGVRFRNIYEQRDRYYKHVSLERAIVNLAPNYRNSYVRMFSSSFISREWLIDLCVHLRFNYEEVSLMLESAHMVQLSEYESSEKYFTEGGLMAVADNSRSFSEKSLNDKLIIMLILGGYMKDHGELPEYLSARRILESFSIYDQGASLVEMFYSTVLDSCKTGEGSLDVEFEDIWKVFAATERYRAWAEYMDMENDADYLDDRLYQTDCEGYEAYMELNERQITRVKTRDEIQLMHFLVAMYYSVLLNKKYEGKLLDKDLLETKIIIGTDTSLNKFIYGFFSTLFGVFIGEETIYKNEKGKYYVINHVLNNKTRALDIGETLENIYEAIVELSDQENVDQE